MNGLRQYIELSNYNLQEAISKTKNKDLKKELKKRLNNNKRSIGVIYSP